MKRDAHQKKNVVDKNSSIVDLSLKYISDSKIPLGFRLERQPTVPPHRQFKSIKTPARRS
jgi:hypothetical protein